MIGLRLLERHQLVEVIHWEAREDFSGREAEVYLRARQWMPRRVVEAAARDRAREMERRFGASPVPLRLIGWTAEWAQFRDFTGWRLTFVPERQQEVPHA